MDSWLDKFEGVIAGSISLTHVRRSVVCTYTNGSGVISAKVETMENKTLCVKERLGMRITKTLQTIATTVQTVQYSMGSKCQTEEVNNGDFYLRMAAMKIRQR